MEKFYCFLKVTDEGLKLQSRAMSPCHDVTETFLEVLRSFKTFSKLLYLIVTDQVALRSLSVRLESFRELNRALELACYLPCK